LIGENLHAIIRYGMLYLGGMLCIIVIITTIEDILTMIDAAIAVVITVIMIIIIIIMIGTIVRTAIDGDLESADSG
jgi:hypothetical protein